MIAYKQEVRRDNVMETNETNVVKWDSERWKQALATAISNKGEQHEVVSVDEYGNTNIQK